MLRGRVTRLNSQVMVGGGLEVILQASRPTDPWVTTMEVGWLMKEEIPGTKRNGKVRVQ